MKIIKKEVKFNNDKVLAVMKDCKLYVGVSNICLNLEMSQDMKRRQVKNVQSDLILSKGCVKFDTGVFDQYNQTLAIELNYLPLWLAKINITPNMINEKEKLVKKLVTYQLHAKDVLASAFLDKPKALPKPKEHKIIKKYYNKVPVMSMLDLATITGRDKNTMYYHAGENKTLIHKTEMAKFKKENPMLPNTIAHMSILYKEEVINICKKMKVYNKVKPQISAYFDDVIQEADKVSDVEIKSSVNENKKAEILLQTLPYIKEEGLKNCVAVNIIKLVDIKILEEFETENFKVRLIDSSDEILYRKEIAGHITSLVKTDRPFEEVRKPGLYITNVNGFKYIAEKIK